MQEPGVEQTQSAEPGPRFAIYEYSVEGNTVLERAAIERAVYPYLGAGKTFSDIEGARQNLEKTYLDAGYGAVAVEIPEQEVKGGVVRLKVIEGRLEKVRVRGSRYHSLRRIREGLPALKPGAVLHMPEVQEQIAALNRASADRQVTPVLRAGDAPGTVALDLRVKDELPLHAALEYNNRYSANTTHRRAAVTVRYDNLWQREHSLSFSYQTAPENRDEVDALGVTYALRSNGGTDATVFYAVRADSNISNVGGQVSSVVGNGNIYGIRHIVPLSARGTFQHSLSLGIDYKDFKEDTNLLSADTLRTPIRYWPLSVGYNTTSPDEHGTTTIGVLANFSLMAFSEKQVDCNGIALDQFECKRVGAKANYFYLRTDFQRTQSFRSGFGVVGRFGIQVASDPLISNEQYGAGGMTSVRGYLDSERFGDSGWQVSVEGRTPSWRVGEGDKFDTYGLIFYEAARLKLQEPLPEQKTSFELASIGIGMHFMAWQRLNAEWHLGYPLKDGAVTRKGDERLQFRLEYAF
ncbi:MAG TPA: POTRA domain-containing protein [Burkholderiales bacterium]|nr:POTRA domain-containing protein [Burkholderiales bacterium]